MNDVFKKIFMGVLVGLAVAIPVRTVNASSGYLDKSSITTCNGKQYGSHDGHWHLADENGKAKGASLGEDWTCQVDKYEVQLSKCVDGDTAKFLLDNEEITARFLAIDTPETKHPTKGVEPFGPEASEYTCNRLETASKIEIQYDSSSTKTDKYDRHLVWVFVDNSLLQKELITNGLAKVDYLYNNYEYTEILQVTEKDAQQNRVGIWSGAESVEESRLNNLERILVVVAIVIFGFVVLILVRQKKINEKDILKIAKKFYKQSKKQS